MIFEKDAISKFGPPSDRFVFQDLVALVYPPENHRFRFWLRDNPFRVRFQKSNDKAVFSVADLSSVGANSFDEKGCAAGELVCKVVRCMPAGVFRFALKYTGSTLPGQTVFDTLEVGTSLQDRYELLATGALPSATNCVTGTFYKENVDGEFQGFVWGQRQVDS